MIFQSLRFLSWFDDLKKIQYCLYIEAIELFVFFYCGKERWSHPSIFFFRTPLGLTWIKWTCQMTKGMYQLSWSATHPLSILRLWHSKIRLNEFFLAITATRRMSHVRREKDRLIRQHLMPLPVWCCVLEIGAGLFVVFEKLLHGGFFWGGGLILR